MDSFIGGALISGGASLAGSGLSMLGRGGGSTSDNSTFYQNWRNDDMAWAREQFDRNEALQREFAQNGVAWRVQDAKNAGLHPLAALGVSGASASPISVGGGGNYSVDFGRSSRDDTGAHIGRGISDMGQNLSRAYMASQTPEQKVLSAFELARQAQQLEHGDLQNEYLRLQMARSARPGAGDGGGGMPSTINSASMGVHSPQPYETVTANPKSPHASAGPTQPEAEYRATGQGSVSAFPAKGLNIDEMGSPGYVGWMFRNGLLPFLDKNAGARPPESMLPKGAIGWTHHFGEWYPNYGRQNFKDLPNFNYPYKGSRFNSKPPVYERD